MPTETIQEDFTPEDAKASLGLATFLQEQQFMPRVEEPVETEEEETPEPIDESSLDEKIESQVEKTVAEEMADIKAEIKNILNEPDQTEQTGTTPETPDLA